MASEDEARTRDISDKALGAFRAELASMLLEDHFRLIDAILAEILRRKGDQLTNTAIKSMTQAAEGFATLCAEIGKTHGAGKR